MIIKKTSAYSSIAYIAVACQFLQWIGHPLGLNSLVSLSVSILTITIAFAFFLLCQDRTGSPYKTNDLTFLLLLIVFVSVCAVLTHPINMDLLKKLLVFFQFPILLMVAKRTASKSSRDFIYTVNAFYPIFSMYCYNSSFSHRYVGEYGEVELDALTLGFSNPNETAIYLMISAFLLLAAVFRYKNLLKRTVLLAEFVWMVYLIYETECRAAVFLIGAVVVGTIFWRNMKVTARFVRNIFIGAAMFFLVLYWLPSLQKLTFMGDSLETGRSSIFSDYLSTLGLGSLIVGDLQNYPLDNMHNAFLTVAAAFGVVSALAFWGFLYRGFKHICVRVPKNREHKVLLLSCMAIVLHSSVEAALLVNGVVYATFVFLMLFMTFGCENERISR